jgi:NitT/TauT family transport system substrate-binding protein
LDEACPQGLRELGYVAGQNLASEWRSAEGVAGQLPACAAEKGGLTLDDVQIEPMGYPDMLAALANGGIDGGIFVEPFGTQAVARDLGVRWHGNEDFYPHAMRGALMYGPRLVDQDPDAGTRFMIAYLKGTRDYLDAFERGVDKEAVLAALIKHTAVQDRTIYDVMDPAGINRHGYADLGDLEGQQDCYGRPGLQPTPADLRKVVDHSFVARAPAVLGKQ